MAEDNIFGICYTVEARTAALLTAQNEVHSHTSSMSRDFETVDESVEDVNKTFGKLSSVAGAVMAVLSGNNPNEPDRGVAVRYAH